MLRDPVYIFFDGHCPLCIGWVKFLLDRDGYNRMRFSPLDSDWTHRFFENEELPHPGMESIVVWDGLRFYFGSEAILFLFGSMPGIWKYLRFGKFVPLKLREHLYGWIAENRSKWFDPRETCWIPNNEDRKKFPGLSSRAHSTPR